MVWIGRALSVAALAVVAWACLTSWGAVVHGSPAYAAMLVVTVVLAVVSLVRLGRPPRERSAARLVGGAVSIVLWALWIVAVWWLRPFSAVEPAIAAMQSDARVTVTESWTDVTLAPTEGGDGTAVLFQPGAKVEARAYAAVLRPLAEAGHTVVIVKQPLGIAFFSLGALSSAQSAHPDISRWIVGGHSLGGTVAAIEADDNDSGSGGDVAGLLLYASYPASDMSTTLTADVLSIYASNDGLATPADIDASKADLPASAQFVEIDGAVHSYFGDYGPQPGDGTPTISQQDARQQISFQSVGFVGRLATPAG
ncbi:MAG: alpha/beta hydrolase [Actinobacteria bacterium]|nr:alpha/beta hydrolase [Actinomycetota bacterium]